MNPLDGIDATYDHLAIAGPSLPDLLTLYRDTLGGTFSHGEILPIGAVVVTLSFPGGNLELMTPAPGSAFFDRFFAGTEGRGGMHHVTFTVPDLAAAVQVLEARGVRTFGLSYDPDIWSEVFLHPRDNGGVLVQLAQKGPGLESTLIRDLDTVLAATGS